MGKNKSQHTEKKQEPQKKFMLKDVFESYYFVVLYVNPYARAFRQYYSEPPEFLKTVLREGIKPILMASDDGIPVVGMPDYSGTVLPILFKEHIDMMYTFHVDELPVLHTKNDNKKITCMEDVKRLWEASGLIKSLEQSGKSPESCLELSPFGSTDMCTATINSYLRPEYNEIIEELSQAIKGRKIAWIYSNIEKATPVWRGILYLLKVAALIVTVGGGIIALLRWLWLKDMD